VEGTLLVMKNKANKASVRNIAQVAGVSPMAASFALNNKPGVSTATRERILRIARELGYAPNARLSGLMAQVRTATLQDLLPIAWLNTAREKDAWHSFLFQTPYLEGARARALELGYKLEEFWCHEPGMTMRRLSRILYQRGIEGVIVTHPERHVRLDWDCLASVALGASLLVPKLHQIAPDINFNFQLALKSLRRLGYRRIGICLSPDVDSASHYTTRATANDLYFRASISDRVPPLFYPPFWTEGLDKEKKMLAWFKRYKPEVIVGHDNRIVQWLQRAGFRVPGDVGVVHLAVDDDVLDWAGIHSRRRQMGVTAVDQLVALMRSHQYGVPETPLNIRVCGTWQNGRTLHSKVEKESGKV